MRRPDIAELCEDIAALKERGGSDPVRHAARVLDIVRSVLENLADENAELKRRLDVVERHCEGLEREIANNIADVERLERER